MPVVSDYYLRRQLNHDHSGQFNNQYILKAGDTATGTINFPITNAQGCALIASINASTTCYINAVRSSIVDVGNYYSSTTVEGALQEIGAAGLFTDLHYRRIMMLMGS
jgi:hypothetical protein